MNKNTVIIIIVLAVLLCGCPGLFSLCFGSVFALAGLMPGSDIDVFGSSDPASALQFGGGGICFGIVLLVVAVGIVLWARRKQQEL